MLRHEAVAVESPALLAVAVEKIAAVVYWRSSSEWPKERSGLEFASVDGSTSEFRSAMPTRSTLGHN